MKHPICFKKFIKNQINHDWLVIGKGPSFNDLENQDLHNYEVVSLNHVIKKIKAKYAHFIDFDAFEDCETEIKSNAEFIVLPFYPHHRNKSSDKSIIDLIKKNETLAKFNDEGRLLCYDLVTSKTRAQNYVFVDGLFFSGEVVIKLLANSGVKRIITAGIDGGNCYSKSFEDLNNKTLLNNSQSSFSNQNKEISRTIIKYNLNISTFKNREQKFKVFVGAELGQELAFKVLKYSIQINSTNTIEVENLGQLLEDDIDYKKFEHFSRTPFSFQRFFIPKICNFSGSAVYLDSDMLVFSDIRELFSYLEPENEICSVLPTPGREEQNSVFVVNCSSVKWDMEEILHEVNSDPNSYKKILKNLAEKKINRNIPFHWNSLEQVSSETRLIHYTDMPSQPWIFSGNKFGNVWINSLNEAIRDGFISYTEIESGVRAQYLRPSILWEISPNLKNKFPNIIKIRFDKSFRPPYLDYLEKWSKK